MRSVGAGRDLLDLDEDFCFEAERVGEPREKAEDGDCGGGGEGDEEWCEGDRVSGPVMVVVKVGAGPRARAGECACPVGGESGYWVEEGRDFGLRGEMLRAMLWRGVLEVESAPARPWRQDMMRSFAGWVDVLSRRFEVRWEMMLVGRPRRMEPVRREKTDEASQLSEARRRLWKAQSCR